MRQSTTSNNVDTSQKNDGGISHLEWCAGYGGIHLGLRRVVRNLRLIAASEIEGYACANLVAKMEEGRMDSAPIWTNLKTFPCAEFCGLVDIFSAGYPCQPFSHAGSRKGADDPRHLWPFIQRAVGIIRPRCCFFENVEGHLTLGFKDVCHDLDELGYVVAAGLFSAAEIGASHQRKRLFIMAVAKGERSGEAWGFQWLRPEEWTGRRGEDVDDPAGVRRDAARERTEAMRRSGECVSGAGCEPMEDTGRAGSRRPEDAHDQHGQRERALQAYPPGPSDREGWRRVLEIDPSLEPAICKLAHAGALANRVDELRLLGNGVVPDTVAKAFVTLWREIIS